MSTVSKTFRFSARTARALEELAEARGSVSQTSVLQELIEREKARLDFAREEEALDAEWELVIPSTACGLPADSIVLPHQVRTIARDRLMVPPYGRLMDPALRAAVADRLLRHFGLHDLGRLDFEG